MDINFILTLLILLVGLYMAWNIGANDVSNAIGTSVGSKALSLKKAVCIAAVLEFAGAFFLGGNVSDTMQHELLHMDSFTHSPYLLTYGMCGALLGTSLWLQCASFFKLPVSTTHSIIGSILGFGISSLGWEGIEWHMIGSIGLSWLLSPLCSGLISYFLFTLLQRKILFTLAPLRATKTLIPYLLFSVFFVFGLSLTFKGIARFTISFSLTQSILLSTSAGLIAFLIGLVLIRRLPSNEQAEGCSVTSPYTFMSLEKALKHLQRAKSGGQEENREKIVILMREIELLKQKILTQPLFLQSTTQYTLVEKLFGYMQVISACFVAFGHGANDVSNAIAPVASALSTLKSEEFLSHFKNTSWILAFGGFGIVLGIITWGWRVIETIGKKITELTPTRGFCAEFGTAITILVASKAGLPISTTHCLVGSVLGVGLARGIKALNLRTVREIVSSWIITMPASALLSMLCFYLIKFLFKGQIDLL